MLSFVLFLLLGMRWLPGMSGLSNNLPVSSKTQLCDTDKLILGGCELHVDETLRSISLMYEGYTTCMLVCTDMLDIVSIYISVY